MMPVLYHFTSRAALASIEEVGIRPYRLNKPYLHSYTEAVRPGAGELGIFLWPEVTPELVRDFLLFAWGEKGQTNGVLLRVCLPESHLLGAEWRALRIAEGYDDRLKMTHDLASVRQNSPDKTLHCAHFDIGLEPIPWSACRVVGSVDVIVELDPSEFGDSP